MKFSDKKELSFEERAKLFKESVLRAEKRYGVKIQAGYINSCDDDNNLIIEERMYANKFNYKIKNEEVYKGLLGRRKSKRLFKLYH